MELADSLGHCFHDLHGLRKIFLLLQMKFLLSQKKFLLLRMKLLLSRKKFLLLRMKLLLSRKKFLEALLLTAKVLFLALELANASVGLLCDALAWIDTPLLGALARARVRRGSAFSLVEVLTALSLLVAMVAVLPTLKDPCISTKS